MTADLQYRIFKGKQCVKMNIAFPDLVNKPRFHIPVIWQYEKKRMQVIFFLKFQVFVWRFGFHDVSVLFISRQWIKSEDIQRISLLFYNKILEKEVSYFFFFKINYFSKVLAFKNSIMKLYSCFFNVTFKLPLTISDFFLAFPVLLLCEYCFTALLVTKFLPLARRLSQPSC